jgi:hypothetical protein
VRELGEQLDLPSEAFDPVAPLVGEDLDGHHLAGLAIAGAEHLAHPAGTDLVLELEPLAD